MNNKENLLRINQARLARDPANAATLDDVGGSWRELGDVQTALGRYSAAFESFHHQSEIYRNLVAVDPANVKTAIEAAMSHQSIGVLQTRTGDLKAALDSHEKALQMLLDLAAKNPTNNLVAERLPTAYYYLGETHSALAAGSSAAQRNFHRRKAQAFFEQSLAAAVPAQQN